MPDCLYRGPQIALLTFYLHLILTFPSLQILLALQLHVDIHRIPEYVHTCTSHMLTLIHAYIRGTHTTHTSSHMHECAHTRTHAHTRTIHTNLYFMVVPRLKKVGAPS